MEKGDRAKIKAEPGDETGCQKCGGKVFEVPNNFLNNIQFLKYFKLI